VAESRTTIRAHHAARIKTELLDYFSAFWGCVADVVASVSKAPDPKSQPGRFSLSKMQESQCTSAAHDATQSTTKILVCYSHFSGLRSGVGGQ
jgi:hypothetical protein